MGEDRAQEKLATILTIDLIGQGHNPFCQQGNPVGVPLAARVLYGIEKRTM